MNYLAHLVLSGDDDFIKIGNFIADNVKGKDYEEFPLKIKIGILLHRKIDWYTDNHDLVKKSKRRLNKRYGHFKGIVIDILYDHFLAKNWSNYSSTPLPEYTQSFYTSLQDNYHWLPEKTRFMMPYMIKADWISNYAFISGIESVLIGMNRRTKERGQIHLAIEDLQSNYKELEEDFTLFFKDLSDFANDMLIKISTDSEG